VSGSIGELLAGACQRFAGRPTLVRGKDTAAEARSAVPLLVTIGADRPPGATGYDELVTNARSALKISPRAAGPPACPRAR